MAVIKFRQSEKEYTAAAELWSGRGDGFKSLLYARTACENGGGESARLRLALSLYESGNFKYAAEEYLRLYDSGIKTGEVYAGLIKSLSGMTRFASAMFFMREARDIGVFPSHWGGKLATRADFMAMKREISRAYKDNAIEQETARLLYLLRRGDLMRDNNMITDMWFDGNDSGDTQLIYKAAGVFTPDKLNKQTAEKIVTMYDEQLASEDMLRCDILSVRIVALLALGKVNEAESAADDMLNLDIPEDPLDLIKCAVAMISLGDHDAALDYLEELITYVFEERLVLATAIANMNVRERDRAAELFSRVLTINPSNLIAKYWCARLHAGKICYSDYNNSLPYEEDDKVRDSVTGMIAEARLRPGSVIETDEMREKIRYVFESEDTEYARYAGKSMARLGVYEDMIAEALLSPEYQTEFKRDLLTELLTRDHRRKLDVYLFGIKTIALPIDLDGMKCTYELAKVYVSAYVAVFLFNLEVESKLNVLFAQAAPVLLERELTKESAVHNAAGALLLLCGAEDIKTPKDAAALFLQSNSRDIDALRLLIEDACPEARVKRKRRKE